MNTHLAPSEKARLGALHSYAILDTPREEAFDQIARLAAHLCQTPLAVVNFMDSERQWFKASVGLDLRETNRAISFCTHALDRGSEAMVVPDALQHSLFCTNPLVLDEPHIRFYACIPLINPEGFALGTLAVMDRQARRPDPVQIDSLAILAQQVLVLLELRRQQYKLTQLLQERERMQKALLEQTTTLRVASHLAHLNGWAVDLSTQQLTWSDNIPQYRRLGSAINTLAQALELVVPEDRSRIQQAFEACAQGNSDFDVEAAVRLPQGPLLQVRTVGQAVRDAQGKVVRIQGAFQDVTERHAAHAAQRLSEERFHLVARATTDAVWDWNLLTDAMWWNDGMQSLFGVPLESLPPDSSAWTPRLHPEESQSVQKSLQAVLHSTQNNWSQKYRFRCQDGTYMWVHNSAFVIRDSQGKAVRMVGGMANINAQKKAELQAQHEAKRHAELVQVQQKMSALECTMPEVLALVADAALRASDARGAMVELLEDDHLVSRASVGPLARPVGAELPLPENELWPSLREGRTVLCNDTLAEGWKLVGVNERAAMRSILAVPLRANHTVIGVLKAISDQVDAFDQRDVAHLQILSESLGSIVQLRRISAQLQASEQQYKLLFDAHPQPMWVYAQDASERILEVNQAMVDMYGYCEAELLHMGMRDLWPQDPQSAAQHDTDALQPGQRRCAVLRRHRRKDGTEIDVEISERGILFNTRVARQVMVIDVTERLRAERELARVGRAQHLLSTCNETLVRATSEAALLQAICRITVDVGGYRMAWVGLARNDDKKTIEPMAHAGLNKGYLQALDLSWSDALPNGQGPAGTAVRTGQAVIVHDMQGNAHFEGWHERLQTHDFHGIVCLPLRHDGHTFGLLYLYAPEVLQISPEETRLLQELANDLAFGITSLRARKEQQRLQASVLKVAAAVSATTGTEFFVQLARNMAEALDAQVGCVARLLSTPLPGQVPRAASLAVVYDGQLRDNAEYPLQGTPSLELLTQRQHVVARNLSQLYPDAPIVRDLDAQAYAGQQLYDNQGVPLGMVFVLFRQPLENPEFVASTLQIFAARASAELDRQIADAHIRRQASLLDKAQDAIVVRDLNHRILFWNQSAERVYGWSQAEVVGQSVATLLYSDPAALQHATAMTIEHGEWSGEIVQKHRDGHTIDMEGRWTLVRDDHGKPESILAINTDIGARKATEREIQRLAFYDALTGLPNRMLLMDRMHQALANSQRNQQGGALLFIDLDNFKTLNDTLGHDKGDLLLQQVAQRLSTCVRSVDTVARLGGDEFVVMLEALSSNPDELTRHAQTVGEKILSTLSLPYQLAGYQYRSTPSIGIAPFQGDHDNVGDLLQQADLAMYQAKAAGRSTLRFFNPDMQAVVTAHAALETDLRTALAQNQFLLHYQPQVNDLGEFVGVEALVRWMHPERGLVSPAEFIPLAEETGLILVLGRWVLHTACDLLAKWRSDPFLRHLTMAVNVSSRQFRHAGFVNDVARILAITGAPSSLLKLELTESVLVDDMDATIATMTALRTYSVGFALDDFGTGYSSLSYLKRMPLDQLKIDQSFVRDLLTDPNDAVIVNTIIGLSESLGLDVIAEGVETIEQRDFLLRAGCPSFQGYLFSRPLPEAQVELVLRKSAPFKPMNASHHGAPTPP